MRKAINLNTIQCKSCGETIYEGSYCYVLDETDHTDVQCETCNASDESEYN